MSQPSQRDTAGGRVAEGEADVEAVRQAENFAFDEEDRRLMETVFRDGDASAEGGAGAAVEAVLQEEHAAEGGHRGASAAAPSAAEEEEAAAAHGGAGEEVEEEPEYYDDLTDPTGSKRRRRQRRLDKEMADGDADARGAVAPDVASRSHPRAAAAAETAADTAVAADITSSSASADGSSSSIGGPSRDADMAAASKEAGNRHYAAKRYAEAIACYTDAIRASPRTPDQDGARAIYYSNRAACYLSLESWEDALYDCDRALELKPGYVKALMRRITALEKCSMLDEALADAEAWVALEPGSRQAAGEVSRVRAAVAARDDKLKDEMMGKLKDLGNSLLGKFGLSLDNFKAVKDPNTGSYSISFQK